MQKLAQGTVHEEAQTWVWQTACGRRQSEHGLLAHIAQSLRRRVKTVEVEPLTPDFPDSKPVGLEVADEGLLQVGLLFGSPGLPRLEVYAAQAVELQGSGQNLQVRIMSTEQLLYSTLAVEPWIP